MGKFLFVLLAAATGFLTLTAQDYPERWSQDPRQTALYQSGNTYSDLPAMPQNFVFSTQPRVYKTEMGDVIVSPNFRPYPTTNTNQSEVIIKRHPHNPNIMFASANMTTIGGPLFISEGVYVTTNGGVNWFGNDTLTGTPLTNHGGDPGPAIDKNGRFHMTHLGYFTSGMYANYSTNNGLTWSANYTIASGSQDKNFTETDDSPTSPYYGRTYCVWSWFSVAAPYAAVSYTTDGGVTWSAPAQINVPPAGHYAQGTDIRTAPNGDVYVCWTAPNLSFPWTGDYLGFAKSTNGGVTWTVTENAYDMNGIRSNSFGSYGIRVNDFPRIDVDRSGGPRNGHIYVVTAEHNLSPAGTDADIVLHKSTNGGTTWSAGVRVNKDPINNGKLQFFPAVRVDECGGVNVIFYDNRNTSADSAQIMLSRSTDGGSNWTEVVVSDHRFKPVPISGLAGGYSGDYIGITSGNGKLWPVWMDNSTGTYQLWGASITLDPDLSSKDTWADIGLEPNPDPGPMWISTDIWVRRQQDPTFTFAHQHQNPEYRDSLLYPNAPNYVYVKVRNQGCVNGTGVLKVYWAKASTGLNWPIHWVNYVVSGTVYADSIHTATPININIAGGDSAIYEIPWFPPNPSTFSSFGADSAHFCLLSRIELSPTYPHGMTFPEGAGIGANVKNNNNIIWKNITVIDSLPGGMGPLAQGWVMVRNVDRETKLMKLRFTVPKEEADKSIYDVAKIKLRLPDRLMERWREGGAQGENIEFDGRDIYLLNLKAWIGGMKLEGDEAHTINFEFNPTVLPGQHPRKRYNFDVMQYDDGEGIQRDRLVGGERFVIHGVTNYYKHEQDEKGKINIYAYPNPFNPVTQFYYTLPEQQRVTLKIYDLLGREVSTLVSEVKPAGDYSVKFDASALSSGIYFYRFEGKDFVQIRKLVLLK